MVEAELLNAWVERRDADAFTEIFSQHGAMVYGACRRILRSDADAEDVTQECFLELHRSADAINASLAGWLHRLATHRSLDRLKSDKRRRLREARYAEDHTVESETNWDDVAEYIDEAIAELSEESRDLVVRRFFQGDTQEALAERLDLTRKQVRYRLDQSVRDIREALRKRGIDVAVPALAALFLANGAEAAEIPPTLSTAVGKIALAGLEAASDKIGVSSGGMLSMKHAVSVGVGLLVAVVVAWSLMREGEAAVAKVDASVSVEPGVIETQELDPATIGETSASESIPPAVRAADAGPPVELDLSSGAGAKAKSFHLGFYLFAKDTTLGDFQPTPETLETLAKNIGVGEGVGKLQLVRSMEAELEHGHQLIYSLLLPGDGTEFERGPLTAPSGHQFSPEEISPLPPKKAGEPLKSGIDESPILYIIRLQEVLRDGATGVQLNSGAWGVEVAIAGATITPEGKVLKKRRRAQLGGRLDAFELKVGEARLAGRAFPPKLDDVYPTVATYVAEHPMFLVVRMWESGESVIDDSTGG
jgi:RNA polymerase sigma factor (sigma-70 family)